MTKKRYNQIIESWNPEMVLTIRYTTQHSVGRIAMSIAFFLETYKKITKILKNVEIREIYIRNENTGIVVAYFQDLFGAWIYGIDKR